VVGLQCKPVPAVWHKSDPLSAHANLPEREGLSNGARRELVDRNQSSVKSVGVQISQMRGFANSRRIHRPYAWQAVVAFVAMFILVAQPLLPHVEAEAAIAAHHLDDADDSPVAGDNGTVPAQNEHSSKTCHHAASCQLAVVLSDPGTRMPLGDAVRPSRGSGVLIGLRIAPPQGPPRL